MTDDFLDFCKENKFNVEEHNPQWQAVISDKNSVISAGAGTGKTTVLSFRFLRIVHEKKAKPSEILTITFTRKATSEMKDRIYTLLQAAHERNFITDEDLENYSECTISTVDGFCSEIVRKNCIHQGIARDFDMISDSDTEKISDFLVEKLLKENREFSSFFLQYLSVDNIKEICCELAKNYFRLGAEFNAGEAGVNLETELKKQLELSAEKAVEEIENQLENLDLKKEIIDVYKRIETYLINKKPEELEFLKQAAFQLGNSKTHTALRRAVKAFVSDYSMAVTGLENLDKAALFYDFVSKFFEAFCYEKRSRGLLSFNDVMQLTLKILTEDKQQREFYKNAFKYIMIDEFQDNNDDYRKLLYLLSEKKGTCTDGIPETENLEQNKIFLVGDQKQSIYKFRGADVSVFKKLSQSIGEKPIELVTNWRSEPYIINFCNDIFSKIFKNEEHINYEADFSALETKPSKTDTNKTIYILKHSEKNSVRAEAVAVAEFIKEIHSENSKCLVPDKDKMRPPEYGEIGILLRTLSVQTELESVLNQYEIPFSVVQPKSLMQESIANDFWCAIMAVLYPQDKLVLASFLKSPFCAFKDSQIKEALTRMQEEECEDKKIKTVKAILKGLEQKLSEEGLCSAVAYLWADCGYRSFIVSNPKDRSYTQHFDWLYSIASRFESEGKSAVDYADYIRALREGAVKKVDEQVVFDEKPEKVQIMTVHKSKGLAFKVVIVFGADKDNRHGGFDTQTKTDDGKLSLRFMPVEDSLENPIKAILKKQDLMIENAETKRVLYVAATRPKYYLAFSVADTKITEPEKEQTMWDFLARGLEIGPEIEDGLFDMGGYFLEVRTCEKELEESSSKRERPDIETETCSTLSSTVKTAVTEEKEEEFSSGGEKLPVLESDALIDRYDLASGFGTLAHAYIEEAIGGKKADTDFLKDLSLSDKETIIKDAKFLADKFIGSSYLKSLKDQGAELFCEKPLVLYKPEENALSEGRIDLLCVTKTDVTIIDFKTDRYRQEDKHKNQLEAYRTAIEKMPEFKGRNILTNVVYLRDEIK